jgi:hypothetical protein
MENYATRCAFISANWLAMDDVQLGKALNVQPDTIRETRGRLGLARRQRRYGRAAGSDGNARGASDKPQGYTAEQIAWAEANAHAGFNNEARMMLVMHTGKRWVQA